MKTLPTIILAVFAACGGSQPQTRYYRLAAPQLEERAPQPADPAITIEPLAVDDAYADERIVYRTSPYKLDYYYYHRWASPPEQLVTDFLQRGYEASGQFSRVVRDARGDDTAILRGRLVAFEEIDENNHDWVGRVELVLQLEDAQTGVVLWSQRFNERQALPEQDPEGLAAALSSAMARIVERSAPEIAKAAAENRATASAQ